MKALILAAGSGMRLRKYAEGLPKGMLTFQGKTLIERQLEIYTRCGITDVAIVTGYQADEIRYAGVRYFHNLRYAETNMVESLMCAREFLRDGLIVSYADILFEPRLIEGLLKAPLDTGVTVDLDWRKYWEARYGRVDYDTEELRLDQDRIVSLGAPNPPVDQIEARYVGLLKFTSEGIRNLLSVYEASREKYWNKPWKHSTLFQKGYMTDLLQEMIDQNYKVEAFKIRGGWIEFDTDRDYETYQTWSMDKSLDRFILL